DAIAKPWYLPLKYADASEVAYVIERVYSENMNTTPRRGSFSGLSAFSFGGGGTVPSGISFESGPSVDASGNPKVVKLTVGVDVPNNSLALYCSTRMKNDVQTLIAQMEEGAKNTQQVVQVLATPGVDPTMVQQAVDAIQGRRPFGGRGPGGGGFFS